MYPHIWIAADDKTVSSVLIKHELIHIEQIRRVGVIRFYAQYFAELGAGLLKYLSYKKAYYAISFEVEAYKRQIEPITEDEHKELFG